MKFFIFISSLCIICSVQAQLHLESGIGMMYTKFLPPREDYGQKFNDADNWGYSLDIRLTNWRKHWSKGCFIMQYQYYDTRVYSHYARNGFSSTTDAQVKRMQMTVGFLPLRVLKKIPYLDIRLGYVFQGLLYSQTRGYVQRDRHDFTTSKHERIENPTDLNALWGFGPIASVGVKIIRKPHLTLSMRCTPYVNFLTEINTSSFDFAPVRATFDVSCTVPLTPLLR